MEKITKDNLLLAQRIFAIMEGPGMITDMMNHNDHLERHPGTLNFNKRLAEARRIHSENIAFASRLDSMKPYYNSRFDNDVVLKLRKKRLHQKQKRSLFSKGLRKALDNTRSPLGEDMTAAGAAGRRQHVLLEYTKAQNGRVLDVAVVKEPFRDRFVIFGIDIEDGQRFELQLSSEDVSSIVDGDILVTSVDHIEVWMALLRKVELLPVDSFTLPALGESSLSANANRDSESISESAPGTAEAGAGPESVVGADATKVALPTIAEAAKSIQSTTAPVATTPVPAPVSAPAPAPAAAPAPISASISASTTAPVRSQAPPQPQASVPVPPAHPKPRASPRSQAQAPKAQPAAQAAIVPDPSNKLNTSEVPKAKTPMRPVADPGQTGKSRSPRPAAAKTGSAPGSNRPTNNLSATAKISKPIPAGWNKAAIARNKEAAKAIVSAAITAVLAKLSGRQPG